MSPKTATHAFDALVEEITERVLLQLAITGVATPRLLDVKQAAVYLGRSENSVRALRQAGTLRATKIDNAVRFDVRELDALIEASKQ